MKSNETIISPKKLIEVALPLDAINAASANEKQPFTRRHPRSIHIWWARRPLVAARAVIFSQLVNDPEDYWRCKYPGKDPNPQDRGHWTKARTRLFKLIEELVLWENTTNEEVLGRAREEIKKSWREVCELNKSHPQSAELFNPDTLPGLYDPFAGGGSIPLEAQRLGLEAYASDLNPVAVLINKAMIEIPPRFIDMPPVGPTKEKYTNFEFNNWKGASGLAEDVRRYGIWVRDEAFKRIGKLYPPIEITKDMATERLDLKPYVNEKLPVIAWLWARTVKSPNPAFSHVDVPLASTFILCNKSGKEVYVEPVVEGESYDFKVKVGKPPAEAKGGTKAARANFRCLMSDAILDAKYIRQEAQSGRMGTRLMAIVAEGHRGRVYLSPIQSQVEAARPTIVGWKPDLRVTTPCHDIDRLPMYGMFTWGDAFTPRQLVTLTTLSDLVGEVRAKVQSDAIAAGWSGDDIGLNSGGKGAKAYAEAVNTYLGIATSRWADLSNSICSWNNINQNVRALFARQAIPMSWDFVELSPFSNVGPWLSSVDSAAEAMKSLLPYGSGIAFQCDASSQSTKSSVFISTDPPYYDNIGYADLSDFFYVWLRRTLRSIFPELFSTISVPKTEELIASTYRHGSKPKAEAFFLNGMTQAMSKIANQAHPSTPITIYYAFKQSETESQGTKSTGWETFLEAVLRAGLSIVGTWPIRTERAERSVGLGTNSLASSIVLVCRPRSKHASSISRRQLVRELNAALPLALDNMTRGDESEHSPVAPVDLSQAIIGPGMAIFSKYAAVLEADGSPMTVRTALQLINRFLAEDDFDADTQFCLHWFEQYGWNEAGFGEADVLARAKGTSVEGIKTSGVLFASSGIVRLLKWIEYPTDWKPETDKRLPVWEVLHQLIRVLRSFGESGAGAVLAHVQNKAEATRQLAYRLYTLCERANMAEDARAYNELVTSWTAIEAAAMSEPTKSQQQLFDE